MLSLVVPTYQAERHLPRLLASLDSDPSWEVIIVDDGSTDGTADIANDWLSNRDIGTLLQQDHLGPGVARQRGLKQASRPFVAFADSDDEVVTSVHNSVTAALDISRSDVAITAFEVVPARRPTSSTFSGRIRGVAARRVLTSRAAIWGKVYRRDFLLSGGIEFPPLRSADDVIFSWRTATRNPVTLETSEVGYRYWVDPHGQLTHDPMYFIEGTDSLAGLWREAFHRPTHGRALAAYACGTGLGHILRKSQLRLWPQIAARALSGVWHA